MPEPRTRLAPSPTGALHLGNARTFLINWAMARQNGWRIMLRIEDLDGPRIKTGADELAIDTLRWLGMDWDEGPTYQLHDLSRYHAALQRLADAGLIYPCACTRKEIAEAQSAPHGDSHDLRYPGTCRPAEPTPTRYVAGDDQQAWRVHAPDGEIVFDDGFAGRQAIDVQATVGDFVVASKAGLPAYQLAVVVDDHDQGVTHIVRGDDLITSTPRQLLLYRLLGYEPTPSYTHVPLVLGEDGHRLAKRHGDTRVSTYRDAGVSAERIVGLIAGWCGLGERTEMTAAEFAEAFDLAGLPRESVTFTGDDDRWLTEGSR
ncbi:MAG: tRNA glutamyl-Q(34) synthetase GluQRS [Phycisphaera sp.]|nr:tRNA glutamyl-Q(34) synthetase GluQRS [Phycisphaera sp.]